MLLLYKFFLHLYPPDFRLEFASEMQSVFSEAASEAARQGRLSALSFFLRELFDFPRSLLWVHWQELRHKLGKAFMDNTPELLQSSSHLSNPEPVSWREALLAGTPALILPLIFILVEIIFPLFPASWQASFSWISTVISCGLLLAGVIWVWRLGWPRWSGGWTAWGWVLLLLLPELLLQNLNITQEVEVIEFYFKVVLITAITLLLYRLMRKDAIKGILAALVLMNLFWLPHLEFLPILRSVIVLSVAWLTIALFSVLIMKQGQVRYAVGFALLATFLVAFPFTYAANYLRVYPADAPASAVPHQADVSDLTYYFAPPLVGSFALLLGPLLLSELQRLSRRSGQAGQTGFRLAFSGLLLNLVGNLTAIWLPTSNFWSYRNPPAVNLAIYYVNRIAPVLVVILAYLGLGLYMLGAFLIVRLSRKDQALPGMLVSVLLVLLPAFLPMLAMFPSWFGLVAVPQQVPFGFLHLERFQYLSYLVGLLVLAVAGWLAAQLNKKEIGLS